MDSDLDIEDICCFELDGLNFKEMLKRKKESHMNTCSLNPLTDLHCQQVYFRIFTARISSSTMLQ